MDNLNTKLEDKSLLMQVGTFTIKESKVWFNILCDNQIYCKTKTKDSAEMIVKLLTIYENALKQAEL